MEKHNEETLLKLAKKKLNLEKLKDKHVLLHPEISKWRDKEKPDIQMLRSLNNNGQHQAVTLRKLKKGDIQLLAGARRYGHMKLLGWTWEEIKKDVREDVSDREALILALEENVRRKNLTVMEEARAVNSLLKNKMSIKAIGKLMGQSPSWVSSRKNLFQLPEKTRKLFEKHDLPYGYSVPLRKLKDLPEAQEALIEKIVEAKNDGYGRMRSVEGAEEFVAQVLKEIRDKEELLLKYGPCPICGSKDITKGHRDNQLRCRSDECGHSWHGETKEAWSFWELKQDADRLGIELVEEAPGTMKVTPKDVADMIERKEKKEREAAKEEEEKLPNKFRTPVRLPALIIPMIHDDNIQEVTVSGNRIEVKLIESSELHFTGIRKDYKDEVNKSRIVTNTYYSGKGVEGLHEYINAQKKE